MNRTPFFEFHQSLGAKIVPFAGFEMPVEYSGITDEHICVRERVGVFDVSHMGEFIVKGDNALNFIQYVTSNDASVLYDGKVQYTCFPNGKGGIVDDLLVYRISSKEYLLVVNAANIEKDWNWCVKYAEQFGIVVGEELINVSSSTAQLAIQGPLAMKAMQKLTDTNITDMEYYTFKIIDFAGIKNVLFSTTGYTGAGGCEVYVDSKDAVRLWNAVFEAGEEFGIQPIGLGARDTLRLEKGFCLYGNDINDTTSPIEGGLGWVTKFNKDFIDKDFLLKQKKEGVQKRLKGFVMVDRAIPRQHYEIVNAEGNTIGEVTSGTMSPCLKQGIGMGYLSEGFWEEGSEIYIVVRGKHLKAVVTKLPFVK